MAVTSEFLNKALRELRPLLEGSSVPLVRVVGESVRAHASGILVEVGKAKFVVTAAHALVEDWRKTTRSEHFNIGTAAVHRGGRIVGISGSARWNPDLDVGVIRLTDACAQSLLEEHLCFLSQGTFDIGLPPARGSVYLVHGWPLVGAAPKATGMQLEPFVFRTSPYIGPTDGFSVFDPDRNFALAHDRNGLRDNNGNEARAPEALEGISGCGVWRLLGESANPELWTVDSVRCIGVQHTVYKPKPTSHAIVGTHWHEVARLISQEFPDVRHAIVSSGE